jgi:guanosine-3',5'-bis(diphosphate) 3'-pyrophosphohydrolase
LANVLCNEGGVTDSKVLCAALLHDTVEDTQTTPEELEVMFGAEIRSIVREVTDNKELEKEERKRLQIKHAAHASKEAKLVKLADKISNLRDIIECPPADWSLERKRSYFNWSKQVVDQVRGVNPTLEKVFDECFASIPE